MKHFGIALIITLCGSLVSHASETVEGAKKDYQAFKQEMNFKLAELDKKIEKVKSESKENKEEVVKDLETSRDRLRREIADAQKVTASKWSDFKKSFAQSVDNLNTRVQKALNK